MRVKFFKHVHAVFASVSSEDVFLERIIEIPDHYPLVLGARISHGDWEVYVEEININLEHDPQVEVYDEPNKQLYNAELYNWPKDQWPDLRTIVSDYLKDGWELPERYHGRIQVET